MSSTIIKPHQLGIKPQQLSTKHRLVTRRFLNKVPQMVKILEQRKHMSKQSLKHIIHDLNHHLMLIGLSADNLAESSNRNQRASENARILRRNLRSGYRQSWRVYLQIIRQIMMKPRSGGRSLICFCKSKNMIGI